jgi:hypothetical protein
VYKYTETRVLPVVEIRVHLSLLPQIFIRAATL